MAEVTLLGIAQDGGRPQPSCINDCCKGIKHDEVSFPTSLGATFQDGTKHLFDVTRNLGQQLKIWNENQPNHIWLTHAHFGHVDGLGLLGKETMNAKGLDLHVSSSMFHLIEETPQWALMLKQGVFSERVFTHGDAVISALREVGLKD